MSPGILAVALRRVAAWSALAVAFCIPLAVPVQLRVAALDFAAFYCAGEALEQHADPYRVMPLGACERRVSDNKFVAAGGVMPAPLPPYALRAFALLSRLPFEIAQRAFDLLSIAALALSALLVRRTTGRPAILVAYALAPIAWIVLLIGQPVILLLAALSATAFLLDRGRDRAAALCACAMMAEPHLGLPVCIALFLYRPRTRLTLFAGAAGLALLLAAVPWSLSVEYLAAVLPLHALSEARAAAQISFTSLLTFFGVPDRLAILIGGAQYAATAAFGILIARKAGTSSALALVPALFALVGGSYLHRDDLLLGIPAALLFWERRPLIAALAIVAVSVPWGGDRAIEFGAIVPAVVLISYAGTSARRALLMVPVLTLFIVMFPIDEVHAVVMPPARSTGYAQTSWSAWEAANPRSPRWLTTTVPDWIGIIAICFLAARKPLRRGLNGESPAHARVPGI